MCKRFGNGTAVSTVPEDPERTGGRPQIWFASIPLEILLCSATKPSEERSTTWAWVQDYSAAWWTTTCWYGMLMPFSSNSSLSSLFMALCTTK